MHLDIIVQVLPLFYKPLVLPTMWRLASRCHGRANFLKHRCVRAKMFSSFPCSSDFVFSSEVRAALKDGRPVVALESTIIAHGMPASASFLCVSLLVFPMENMSRKQTCNRRPFDIGFSYTSFHVCTTDSILKIWRQH